MITLFRQNESNGATVACQIIDKLGITLFSVKDSTGRKFNAESSGAYKVGDWVVVRSGIIVGKSKKPTNIIHANV